MIRYLRLPFCFDAGQMWAEVLALKPAWNPHFNTLHYDGRWSGVSLRAPGGNADNLVAEALGTAPPFADTPLLAQCPSIRSVLASLQCPQTSVRLLKLDRGAVVKEHTDAGLNYESGEARLHIPLMTHPEVEFYLDGDRLAMEAGTCWYINAALPHRLANPSPVDRVHLVIDCQANDWLHALFSRTDLPVRSLKDTGQADQVRRGQIVAELRRSGDPARVRLADELEATNR